MTHQDVLDYWFGKLEGPCTFPGDRAQLWWAGGEAVDAEIRERFGALFEQATSGALDDWQRTPRAALALVILLDQFSRNLGRGTPAAFANDDKALACCEAALQQGHDRALFPLERAFLYMPMMHAESREMATKCVAAFQRLSREIKEQCPGDAPDFLTHAEQHASVVERFGRYPHRNEILGRPSSAEEREFLAAGAESYGQKRR